MSRAIILFLFLLFLQGYNAIENDPNRHIRELDNGKYRLEWRVDHSRKRILFNVTVQTLGFVGFGISKRENNGLTDLIIGGVDSRGKAYFTDRNVKPPQTFYPEADKKQDWTLHSSWQSHSHTFLSFSRVFDTCDPEDVPFDDDTVDLHYIYGENDNIFEYFRAFHKTTPVYLKDPELIPTSLTTPNGQDPTEINGRKVSLWTVNVNMLIPPKKTTYICTVRKSSISSKQHILGFNVRINPASLRNVHHIVLTRCQVPSNNSETVSIFEPLVNYQEECYFPGDTRLRMRTEFCNEMKIAFAIGNGPTFFPESVGLPIGESGQDEYFGLQIHYDNPEERSDINSEINIDIYHTPELRKNDGGIFLTGANFPGSPAIMVLPAENNHRIYGHCSSNCTKKFLPQNGIKMVAGFLHAHTAGRKLRLSHFRNGKELKYLMNDENYENVYQPWRLNREEVSILPGDEITMRCSYDTTERRSTLVGGFATDQEMCVSFVLYYGSTNFPYCFSELISPAYTAKYLAGASNLTWDQSKLEFVANAPRHLAGMTVSEISDSGYVNWSREQRQQLQMDHFMHDQVEFCPSMEEIIGLAGAQRAGLVVQLPEPQYVSYTKAIPYNPEGTCQRNYGHFQRGQSYNNVHGYNLFPGSNSRGYGGWRF